MDDFDLIAYEPWIAWGLFVFFFVVCLCFIVRGGEKRISLPMFQLIFAHLLFVPWFVFSTLWCYRHPERLDGNPATVFSDMRQIWPLLVVFDAGVFVCLFCILRGDRSTRALRLLQRARRLLDEGRLKEADAAYEEGLRLLNRK